MIFFDCDEKLVINKAGFIFCVSLLICTSCQPKTISFSGISEAERNRKGAGFVKVIISYNTEYDVIFVRKIIREGENPLEVFCECLKERAMDFLQLTEKEAEEKIAGEDSDVFWSMDFLIGLVKGQIRYEENAEYLQIVEIAL